MWWRILLRCCFRRKPKVRKPKVRKIRVKPVVYGYTKNYRDW